MSCVRCGGDLEEDQRSDGGYDETSGDRMKCKECGHKQQLLAGIFSI